MASHPRSISPLPGQIAPLSCHLDHARSFACKPDFEPPRAYAMAVATEFSDRVSSITDMVGLAALFDSAVRDLGFRYHALVQHGDPTQAPTNYLFVQNYPDIWVEHFVSRGLHSHDPVQKLAGRRLESFAWARLPALMDLSPVQAEIIQGARTFGLGDGFTVPLHAPTGRRASASFVTQDGRALPHRALLAVQVTAQLAFQAARSLVADLHARPRLSRRQQQCVALMAQGKSDWEIGIILSLSEETVTGYLNAARDRFGVARRTQLAIAALLSGDVSIDEIAIGQ